MRLWSIHPKYLDARGLVALWREALLAQSVLSGNTSGYKNHPQLNRFKETINPMGAIASYLRTVANEADERGYTFEKAKILNRRFRKKIMVTTGQLEYEFTHLKKKLEVREKNSYIALKKITIIEPNPLFERVHGDTEAWEIV